MVLVNNPGSWRHVTRRSCSAEWQVDATDLVFPFFCSSSASRSRRPQPPSRAGGLALRILRRSAVTRARAVSARRAELRTWPRYGSPACPADAAISRPRLLFLVSGWRIEVAVAAAAVLGYWAALESCRYRTGQAGNAAAWLDSSSVPTSGASDASTTPRGSRTVATARSSESWPAGSSAADSGRPAPGSSGARWESASASPGSLAADQQGAVDELVCAVRGGPRPGWSWPWATG